MTREDYNRNRDYLERCEVSVGKTPWDDKPFGAELECYTPAGEDMIVCLEELSAECLSDFLDDFDINEHVVEWWPNGVKDPSKGVPFDNIKEHYEDYEAWLEEMRGIVDLLV